MKKILSFVMAVVVLFSLFSFRTSRAQAAGIIKFVGSRFIPGKGAVFLFKASGVGKNAAKSATIFAGSNFYNLFCTVKKDDGLITCLARAEITQFQGQTGIVHLAGQIFYVMVPYFTEPPDEGEGEGEGDEGGDTSSVCPDPLVLGATVTYSDNTSEFIAGNSLDAVAADAQSNAIENGVTVKKIGDLHCDTEPL